MSKVTAERQKKQLGMPYGTACHRLRQQLLFSFAEQLSLLSCFVCSERIENVETFSIEHKEHWLDVSSDLFWDIDNIAFSHRSCNRPHRKSNHRKYPLGFANCQTCGILPLEKFSKLTSGAARNYCKPCRAKRRKAGLTI